MRALIIFILCLSINSSLFALYYKSNALSQRLEELDSYSENGYVLKEDGEKTTLFYNNEIVNEVTHNSSLRVEKSKDREIQIRYNGPLVESEVEITSGGKLEKKYEYTKDGILKRTIIIKDEDIQAIINYDYSTLSGLVSFYKADFDSLTYIGNDQYTFQDNGKATKLEQHGNLLIKSSDSTSLVSKDDDTITLVESDEERVYYLNGNIKEIKSLLDGEVVSIKAYEYDSDNNLTKTILTSGDNKEITIYEGSKAVVTTYIKDVIQKQRFIGSDLYEIVYKDGKEWARITYDSGSNKPIGVVLL